MDIENIKLIKRETENKITQLILQFMKETNLNVTGINYDAIGELSEEIIVNVEIHLKVEV